MIDDSPKKKRKREDALEARITYHTPLKTFERLFQETSLEDTRHVVRRKLGLADNAKIQLSQMRGNNIIVLDDDDDFQAFCVTLKANPLVDVQVTLSDASSAEIKDNEAPASKKRKAKRKEEKQAGITTEGSSEQALNSRQQAASILYTKAWGKPWPQSKGTIFKTEISGDESGSVDDDDVDTLTDKLHVPPEFKYRYFKEIQGLKSALGANRDPDFEDVLVVREEYEMLRHALEDKLEHWRAFVVTGHPGIGKTTFLFYLLLYRLERKLPTAIQLRADDYFIFDEQGAIVHSLLHYDPRLAKCWALTDSNYEVSYPCGAFNSLAELVILASSPKPERWKRWIKQRKGFCIILDLPSVPEIAAIAKELRKRQIQLLYDSSSTLSLVRKWGPSTRNIIRSMECAALGRKDPIEEEAQMTAILICQNPSATFGRSLDLGPQSEGSSVIFLRRTPDAGVMSVGGKRFIPTPHLLALFEEQRRQMENKESLQVPVSKEPLDWLT